jgi:hypothetical protein
LYVPTTAGEDTDNDEGSNDDGGNDWDNGDDNEWKPTKVFPLTFLNAMTSV